MTPSKVIKRLVEYQPEEFRALPLAPTRCIMATAIGCDVLAAFDIDARPLSVKLDVMNRIYCAWVKAGKPGGTENAIRLGCYALSAGYEEGEDGYQPTLPGCWNGHLMIEVPAVEVLIDLDMQQMNRPAKDIMMPSASVLHWNGGPSNYETPGGGVMRIEARREDLSYRVARDWWARGRFQDITKALVRRIRKGR